MVADKGRAIVFDRNHFQSLKDEVNGTKGHQIAQNRLV